MKLDADASVSSSHDILVLTDATPASTNAIWRGALIAREQGASLRVQQVADGRASILKSRQSLDALGKQVQARLGIELHAEVLHGDFLAKAINAAHSSRLLVIGLGRTNTFREWISGTQVERLIRLCRVPTLVVKRPAMPGRSAALGGTNEPGSYGRVLIAVDLGTEAADVISAAVALSRDPQTDVIYALGAGSEIAAGGRGKDASGTSMQRAQTALKELIRFSCVRDISVVPTVAFGPAAACVLIRERAIGAELIVIGKRKRGMLGDFFLGGVTQKVLAASAADVLVIPGSKSRLGEGGRSEPPKSQEISVTLASGISRRPGSKEYDVGVGR